MEIFFPFACDVCFILCAGFIVHDLVGDNDAPGPDVFHDSVVYWNLVGIFPQLEHINKDGIGAVVVTYHTVVVSAEGLNTREATKVINKEFRQGD